MKRRLSLQFLPFLLFLLLCLVKTQLPEQHHRRFQEYIQRFQRPYAVNSTEYFKRFEAFKASLLRHRELNKLHSSQGGPNDARFGITIYSDLTPQEFQDLFLRYTPSPVFYNAPVSPRSNGVLKVPSKIDWRQNGSVTAVKDQKACGACWAFAVVETAESMHHIQHGQLGQLSVQEVINCAQGQLKCDGGDIAYTADWLIRSRTPIVSEDLYPLTDTSGQCTIHPTKGVVVASMNPVVGYVGAEDGLLNLLTGGPVAVAVNSGLWQDYLGGVIQHHCPATPINHAVQLVGYDLSGPVPFYIARNSWGPKWGDQGYLYLKIGANTCGVATEAVSIRVD